MNVPAWHIVRYFFSQRTKRALFTFVILTIALISLLLALRNDLVVDGVWGKFLDPLFGITPVFAMIFVVYYATREEWERQLPRLLTVHLVLLDAKTEEKRVIMTCRRAFLAHEGDMRPWGMQIGRQWGGSLSLEPFIDMDAPEMVLDGGAPARLFTIYFFLDAYPAQVNFEKGRPHPESTYFLLGRPDNAPADRQMHEHYAVFPTYQEIKSHGIDHWKQHHISYRL